MRWQDLARRQAGVVARAQLAASGLSERRVQGMIARGELIQLLPAVYAPPTTPSTVRRRMWAAALWSDGVLSHRTAAQLWRLPVQLTTVVHVTVDDRRFRAAVPDVRVHRVRLHATLRTSIDDLPVTTERRTVVDLLRTEPFAAALDLLDRTLRTGLMSEAILRDTIRREPGRSGNLQLRELIDGIEPGAHAESERRLHTILRRAKLVGWRPQYRIRLPAGTAFADEAFPDYRIAIEVDGRRTHDVHSDQFETDRLRQNEIVLLGWRVLRFTWSELTYRPERVLAKIVAMMAVPFVADACRGDRARRLDPTGRSR